MRLLVSIMLIVLSIGCSQISPEYKTQQIVKTSHSLKDSTRSIVKVQSIKYFGSGIIIHQDTNYSYVITNCHVLSNDSGGIDNHPIVIFGNGDSTRYMNGEVLCFSPIKDIVVLKCKILQDSIPSKLSLKHYDDLANAVFLIGYPKGSFIISTGIFSGIKDVYGRNSIVSSCYTEHGASGGGLFDSDNNLIGMCWGFDTTLGNFVNFSLTNYDIANYIISNKLSFLIEN